MQSINEGGYLWGWERRKMSPRMLSSLRESTCSLRFNSVHSVSTPQSMLLKSWKPLFFHLDCREGDLAVFRSQEDLRKGPPFAKKYVKLEYNYRCTEIKLKEYGKVRLLY